jgi:hypothetical protein
MNRACVSTLLTDIHSCLVVRLYPWLQISTKTSYTQDNMKIEPATLCPTQQAPDKRGTHRWSLHINLHVLLAALSVQTKEMSTASPIRSDKSTEGLSREEGGGDCCCCYVRDLAAEHPRAPTRSRLRPQSSGLSLVVTKVRSKQ